MCERVFRRVFIYRIKICLLRIFTMLTRTFVPHYPPATCYPTILPRTYCTRGWKPPSMKVSSIFEAKNDMNARDNSWRNKSRHWRRSLRDRRTDRCWKMRYIFVITYYKLRRGRYLKKRQIHTYKVSQIKCYKPVSKELPQIRFLNIISRYLHIVSNI